jgi:hypothetical protein
MTETERHFRVAPIGRRFQPQHTTTDGRWVWEGSTAYETRDQAQAAAGRSAARWLGKLGNTSKVEG